MEYILKQPLLKYIQSKYCSNFKAHSIFKNNHKAHKIISLNQSQTAQFKKKFSVLLKK